MSHRGPFRRLRPCRPAWARPVMLACARCLVASMRKLALAGSVLLLGLGRAAASDMALPQPGPLMYSPVPVANWNGFYAGAHIGAAWSYFDSTPVVFAVSGSASSVAIGL